MRQCGEREACATPVNEALTSGCGCMSMNTHGSGHLILRGVTYRLRIAYIGPVRSVCPLITKTQYTPVGAVRLDMS